MLTKQKNSLIKVCEMDKGNGVIIIDKLVYSIQNPL